MVRGNWANFVAICIVAFGAVGGAVSAKTATPVDCSNCVAWNAPQAPFKIYGNTYYVGVRGLSAILIASDKGHILIDGDLPQSAIAIAAHIHALGFRIEDVKLILNSHAHFDHAGGIAELQRLSRAEIAASPWSAGVFRHGGVGHGDPQSGSIVGIDPVARTRTIKDGETMHVGSLAVTASFTPGHTPGGTSWTWKSCENARCFNIVYAESLSPVSADDFRFTANANYPNALSDFDRSFKALEKASCDILLTPHPEFSDVMGRLAKRNAGAVDSFIDSEACRRYVASARAALAERVEKEATAAVPNVRKY